MNFIQTLKQKFEIYNKEYTIDEIISYIISLGIDKNQIIINNNNSIIILNYYRGRNAHIGLMNANNINQKVIITNIGEIIKALPLCDINNPY